MYTKNLTVKEMYATINSTPVITELFKKGLEINNDRLAVSAMEELLLRGDPDPIVESLDQAFEQNQLVPGSVTVALISRSLFNYAGEIDRILQSYGKDLCRGVFMSPSEWVKDHAEQYQKCYRSGTVRHARPWASAQIWGDSDEHHE